MEIGKGLKEDEITNSPSNGAANGNTGGDASQTTVPRHYSISWQSVLRGFVCESVTWFLLYRLSAHPNSSIFT